MATLPMPMQPRGAGTPPRPSVLGGPSGPGGTPMVSPGTGDGQKAMAIAKIEGVINTLMTIAEPFEAGSPELTSLLGAIKMLNNMARKKPTGPGEKPPPAPPVPGMQPGGIKPGGMAPVGGPIMEGVQNA